jgi:hypothetical protein
MMYDFEAMGTAADNTYSTFLFAQPSLLSGVARLFDFGGTFDTYNLSAGPKDADVWASLADWLAVGEDLGLAVEQFEREELVAPR